MLARDTVPSRLTSARRSRSDLHAQRPPHAGRLQNKSSSQWSGSCFSESLHGMVLHGSLRCLHSHECTCRLPDPSSWMPSSSEEEASLTSFLDEVAEGEAFFSAACFAFHSSECFEARFTRAASPACRDYKTRAVLSGLTLAS